MLAPMKIILATESYYPNISGVAVSTFLVAKTLVHEGHDVWVFAPSTDLADREERPAELNRLTVCRFRSVRNPFRSGFRVALFPGKSARRLVQLIRPDIVHLQDPAGISAAVMGAAKHLGVPVVISHHFSLDYITAYCWFFGAAKGLAKQGLVAYLRRFYNRADAVIAPSHTTANMLLDWGVKTKVSPISNGVSLERFYSYTPPTAIFRRYRLPAHVPIVLYVGRIDRDKSVEVLIEAIPRILQQCRAHFVLVGGGDFRNKCVKKAQQLGVLDSVTWIGPVPHESEDLPQLYQVARVFVIPSTAESQSMVTLEAMASGLPIVGARAGALGELVTTGENGFLFSPGESGELADCVVKILSSPNLVEELGRRSLLKAAEHRVETAHGHLLAVYQALKS